MKETVRKTYEELTAELTAKSAAIDAKITEWNEASISDDVTRFRTMAILDDELKALEKEYAEISQTRTFTGLNGDMLEAIRTYAYPVVKHKDISESGSTIKTRERVDAERQFDLYDFDLFNGSHASKNEKWIRLAEQFNMLCCMHVANELNVEDLSKISSNFFVSNAAKKVQLAEEDESTANPISKTQMLKLLQKVCDNVVYEEKLDENGNSLGNTYKVTSHDVAWLLFTYARKDTKGRITLKVADHKNFRKIIADVLHRVVTNTNYKIAYKEMIKK
jgi:hypothetical protein